MDKKFVPVLMPGLKSWVRQPGLMEDVPKGIECLTFINGLEIQQMKEWAQILTGVETKNKYVVFSKTEQIFFLEEHSKCCERVFCGPNRRFWMNVVDEYGGVVARFRKKCPISCNRYCNCSNASMDIYAPTDVKIGKFKEVTGCCRPTFIVFNEEDQVYKIKAPRCHDCFEYFRDINFQITDIITKEKVGVIGKKHPGILKQFFKSTSFGIDFPKDIDPKMKLILLGATIFIDFRFFEAKQKNPLQRIMNVFTG